MKNLAARICAGDQAAFNELGDITANLYRDIDFQKDHAWVVSNAILMTAAFTELGEQAGRGNVKAFACLKQALQTPRMRSFVPDALGIAAAAGHAEAPDMLLDHESWNILLSSAAPALNAAAEKNNPQAVDFLIGILSNQAHRALWNDAAQGLNGAAAHGNAKAKAALEKYAQATGK